MKVADGIEALELPSEFMGRRAVIWPVLFVDTDGAMLVDTGYPGQADTMRAALAALMIPLDRIQRIVLTHQDVDHIGNAQELKKVTGARVLAHAADVPFIQGERPLLKMNARAVRSRLQGAPEAMVRQVEALLAASPRVLVDGTLEDGQVLPVHGGVQVVYTPGHTPGHISLYVPDERLLIAADMLRVEDGQLLGPNAANTPDMAQAEESLAKLAVLDMEYVLCYHGGLWGPGAGGRLQELVSKQQ